MFGGFGPIIMGIVYFILSSTLDEFSLSGGEMLVTIISTYLLAFIQAGASIFNQIEHWSPLKSILIHGSVLCTSYVVCYLVNSWIMFNLTVVLIFIAAFTLAYLVIWFTVFLCVRASSKRLNAKLKK
jgi:hypothetical protein